MSLSVYWASIEYEYNIAKLCKGGFVYAFIRAQDAQEAMAKITTELKEQKLTSVEMEFIRPYDEGMEWDEKNDTLKYLKLFKESLSTDDVIFDTFYAYEN